MFISVIMCNVICAAFHFQGKNTMISNWVCSTTYMIIIPLCNLFAANCTKHENFDIQMETHKHLKTSQLSVTVDPLVNF